MHAPSPPARGIGHQAALRQPGNRFIGILHNRLKTNNTYNESTAWALEQGLVTPRTWDACRVMLGDGVTDRKSAGQTSESVKIADVAQPLQKAVKRGGQR